MDRLQADLKGQAAVVHIDLMSEPGRKLAREHEVSMIPALLVFDSRGNLILKQQGNLDTDAVRLLLLP